ncbi:MAG: hypothetical protein PHO30_07780, partial [Candidatus Omnitrophica bacterium]|nr:hypothetical protein [Candidatus Omnitrophota bacterium]
MILRKLICRGVLFLLLAGILISCAPIYNMSGLKKLDFSVPEDWQNIKNPDDCTYDYAFRFYNDRAWFEIYLRTVYVPRKNSVQWLEEERKNAQRKGYSSSDITLFTTKAYTWHLLETEDAVAGKQQKIPVRIRHFVAKEEKSPRLIQCELVGEAGSFAQLPAGPVNAFLDSIVLHPVTLKDKPAADYENYVVSAEEEAFLLNGQQLISEEQYARAISLFTSLLNRPITRKLQSRVQVSLGESYLGRGIVPYIDTRDTRDFQEAIQQAKKGLDLRRDDWLAYTTIGAAYLNLAEYA